METEDSAGEQRVQEIAELRRELAALKARQAEWKRSEEQLAVFRRFVEASGHGVGMADLDGRITYVNSTLCRLAGQQRPEDLIEKRFAQYFPGEFRRMLEEEVIPTVMKRGQWIGQLAIQSAGGHLTPTLENFFLVRDTEGNPLYYADVVVDLSDQKRLEQAVHLRDRAIDAASQGICITDPSQPDHPLEYVNRGFETLTGYRKEEVLGRNMRFLQGADTDRQALQVMREAIRDEKEVVSEVLNYRKDGTPFWNRVSISPVRDATGRVTHFVGVLSDVSGTIEAQNALRDSHSELQAIYDGMVDGLLIADVTSKQFVRANRAICRMLGYSESELLAMSVLDIHPNVALTDVLASFEAQAKRELLSAENVPVLRKDGAVFYADITTNNIQYSGRPSLICFFRDITERKRAHEAVQRERQVLEDLLAANDRERQLIAYEIHDGLAQQLAGAVMQLQTFSELQPRDREAATKAFDAGSRILQQSLVETRRLINGLRPPILDERGVTAAIEHLITENDAQGGPMIEFHRSFRGGRLAPPLEGTVFRIVQEAVTNARRHSQTETMRIDLLQEGGQLRLDIRDWGIGFDPELVQGRRFGLRGIRERARLLGGEAAIQSKPHEGTRIRVTLPLMAAAEEV